MEEKKISRQRLYQLRRRSSGRCVVCGKKALLSTRKGNPFPTGLHCKVHKKVERERQRRIAKLKREVKV